MKEDLVMKDLVMKSGDRIVLDFRLTLADGTELGRQITWREIESGTFKIRPQNLPDWIEKPEKFWASPNDPVRFEAKVKEGFEEEARAFLAREES